MLRNEPFIAKSRLSSSRERTFQTSGNQPTPDYPQGQINIYFLAAQPAARRVRGEFHLDEFEADTIRSLSLYQIVSRLRNPLLSLAFYRCFASRTCRSYLDAMKDG